MSISTVQTSTELGFAPVLVLNRTVPSLENGDNLSRSEFERRYQAMPQTKKAELIEGIVYMPSPVRLMHHGRPHSFLVGWAAHYVSRTPYVEIGDNTTSRLDENNEPQPDLMLLLPRWAGGSAELDEDDYVSGAPDLVCEVAASSVSIDLHAKFRAYRRNGVKEYLVFRVEDRAIDWFELVHGEYQLQPADEHGWLRSKVFPGLWLDVPSLLAGDLAKVFAAVDVGTSTDEHKQFVGRLSELAPKPAS